MSAKSPVFPRGPIIPDDAIFLTHVFCSYKKEPIDVYYYEKTLYYQPKILTNNSCLEVKDKVEVLRRRNSRCSLVDPDIFSFALRILNEFEL